MPDEPPRYELKMVADHSHLAWLRAAVRLLPGAFRVAYPPRWVNSLYFDTHELDSLGDNLAGVATRRKVRLRWYGDGRQADGGVLELKCKRDRPGWKQRFTVAAPIDLTKPWPELLAAVEAGLPGEGVVLLRAAGRPTVLNRYLREYYASFDGRVRLTLDSGQEAADQRTGTRPNLLRAVVLARQVVVELKADLADRDEVVRVAQHLNLRVGRNSKYVQALDRTGGHAF